MAMARRRAPFRLLVVEHDAHVIDELREHFGGREFECEVAINVGTARRILAERRMDAIVLDATVESMPRGGVPRLLKDLRAAYPEMRIIVFNGVARKATQRRMRRLGAEGYLSRNSNTKALARSVRRIMDQAP